MDTSNWSGVCQLPALGVIEASGADAASFLHGQLSQDMQNLAEHSPALAAYCSAKGRMLASLWVWRTAPDRFLLVVDQSILAPTLKRLSMFVLRSKCTLRDASAELSVLGCVRPASDGDFTAPFATAPGQPLTGHGSRLGWAIVPTAEATALVAQGPAIDAERWMWLAVLTGVPRISAPTVDQFVPQMINLELIGGVNFQKGCYPGQEVVARSQYRGTTKRRLFLMHSDHGVQAGQEVFSAADPDQPAGMVVNTAAAPGDGLGWHALVELKLAAADAAVHAESAQGPLLTPRALPYAIPSAE